MRRLYKKERSDLIWMVRYLLPSNLQIPDLLIRPWISLLEGDLF